MNRKSLMNSFKRIATCVKDEYRLLRGTPEKEEPCLDQSSYVLIDNSQVVDEPRILIEAKFETDSKSRLLRVLRLRSVLPIDNYVRLKLTFKNLYKDPLQFDEDKNHVGFGIRYPSGTAISRMNGELRKMGRSHQLKAILEEGFRREWRIRIPDLAGEGKHGHCVYGETPYFFWPEVPGNHQLVIEPPVGIKYAGRYGLTGRKYKFFERHWDASFYVYSKLEMNAFYIVFWTLACTFGAVVVSLISLFVAFNNNA